MDDYIKKIQIRWADLDPNFHLRHSVYYDWGAFSRISFLNENNLTMELMQQLNFGPVLFREECVFRSEIVLGDPVTINLEITKARKDYSRWSIQHTIMKNPEKVSAILTIDGAWLNTEKRKLLSPPPIVAKVFSLMPRTEKFQWID